MPSHSRKDIKLRFAVTSCHPSSIRNVLIGKEGTRVRSVSLFGRPAFQVSGAIIRKMVYLLSLPKLSHVQIPSPSQNAEPLPSLFPPTSFLAASTAIFTTLFASDPPVVLPRTTKTSVSTFGMHLRMFMYTFELCGSTTRLQLAASVDTGYNDSVWYQSGDLRRIRDEARFG